MARVPDDVFFASIGELGRRLRAKEFSAVELTHSFCDRLEIVGRRHNAVALPMRDEAVRQARDADDLLKRGRTRSPLLGIPYGAKDLLALQGQPTTWGARPFAGQVFKENARVLDKLNGAGAILVAKLSMIELAGGTGYRTASASLTGPCLNPWDRSRWSGGSSSGSAAATAAGCVTFAIGSETCGSILNPSAYCGLTGLRPTYGLVSRRGAMALAWSLDKIGPICRSAEDCSTVLETISGGDSDDPGSAGKSFYRAPSISKPPQALTLGYAPVDFDGWAEPAARTAFAEGLAALRALGFKMKEVELPDFPYDGLIEATLRGEAATHFEELIRSGRVDQLADPLLKSSLREAASLSATAYLRAQRIRTVLQGELRRLFQSVDLLVSPTYFNTATRVSDPVNPPISLPLPKARGLSDLVAAGSLAGLPAISMPCGLANGLPVGLSLVSRAFTENQLLACAEAFQSSTKWHLAHPSL